MQLVAGSEVGRIDVAEGGLGELVSHFLPLVDRARTYSNDPYLKFANGDEKMPSRTKGFWSLFIEKSKRAFHGRKSSH